MAKRLQKSDETLDHLEAINATLAEACGLALKQPITGRQYVLMMDASFRASRYALMIEEDSKKKTQLKKENFRPSCIHIINVFPSTAKNVHLLQGIFGNLSRLPRIQPYSLGYNPTNSRDDRQQVGNEVFPNQSDPSHTMKRM